MKRFASVVLALLFASPAWAGPRHWIATHKRFLEMEGAAVAGASIHAAGLHHCRRVNGVEPCDGHYGAAWAIFGMATGANVIVLPAVAEGCWKDGQGKFCNVFAYGGSTAQAVHGVREWRIREVENEFTGLHRTAPSGRAYVALSGDSKIVLTLGL